MTLKMKKAIGIVAGVAALGMAVAAAQPINPFNGNASLQVPGDHTKVPAAVHATLTDPAGKPPDSSHIPFVDLKNVKWEVNGKIPGEGRHRPYLWRSRNKPRPLCRALSLAPGRLLAPPFPRQGSSHRRDLGHLVGKLVHHL